MRRNDDLAGTPLVDNAGGGTIFLDTRVKAGKISGSAAPEDSCLMVDPLSETPDDWACQ